MTARFDKPKSKYRSFVFGDRFGLFKYSGVTLIDTIVNILNVQLSNAKLSELSKVQKSCEANLTSGTMWKYADAVDLVGNGYGYSPKWCERKVLLCG